MIRLMGNAPRLAIRLFLLVLCACAQEEGATSALRQPASAPAPQSSVIEPAPGDVKSSPYQEGPVEASRSPFVSLPDSPSPSPLTEQVDATSPSPAGMRRDQDIEPAIPPASRRADNDLTLRAPGEDTGPDALSRRLSRQGHDATAATRAIESLGTGAPSASTQTAPAPQTAPDGAAVIIVPAGGGTPVIVTGEGR